MLPNSIVRRGIATFGCAVALLTGAQVFADNHAAAACSTEEVGYVASFQVKAGSEEAFEAVLSGLADAVNRVEEGALLYAPFRGPEGQYFMMERYKNEAAREAHGKDPEVAAHFPGIGEHLDGAPVITPVSAICSKG